MAGFNRNQVADINRNARPNSSESAVTAAEVAKGTFYVRFAS
jgi:hypothetical protein